MIRNRRGNQFLLITQDDHAAAAARLAERLGHVRFDGPDPWLNTLQAIEMHDRGWPLHDSEPSLNADGFPLDVLETPPELTARVWRESARLAAERDVYAGLLVSLHVFNLSVFSAPSELTAIERFERREELFLVNQFQQDEIERQEELRTCLGLAVDRPLTLGLAPPGLNRDEDRLRFNFSWLQAMDAMSLQACAGKKIFARGPMVHPRIGAVATELTLGLPEADVMTVTPWPFSASQIVVEVPARLMPAMAFRGVAGFRSAYAETAPILHRLTFRPG